MADNASLERQLAAALVELAALHERLERYQRPAVQARRQRADLRNLAVHALITDFGLPSASLADWKALRDRLALGSPLLAVRCPARCDPERPFHPEWARQITAQRLRDSYLAWRSKLTRAARTEAT